MGTIAIPTWNGRISPVFDTALRLLVVKLEKGRELRRFEVGIGEHFLPGKTIKLSELGIDTLICGAISEQFSYMVTNAGITLIPWISGQVEDVLQAYLAGNLHTIQFLRPGRPTFWGKGPGMGRGRGRGRRRKGIHFP